MHYDSSTEKYQIGVTARKNIQLGSSETWLKLSQDALYDPKTQKVMVSHWLDCGAGVCNLQTSMQKKCMQIAQNPCSEYISIAGVQDTCSEGYYCGTSPHQLLSTAPTPQQTMACSYTNSIPSVLHLIVNSF